MERVTCYTVVCYVHGIASFYDTFEFKKNHIKVFQSDQTYQAFNQKFWFKTHLLNGCKIMWPKPNLIFRVDRSTDTWVLMLHRNWKNSSSRSTSIWPKWWNVIISNGYTDKMQMLNHKMYTMQHNCKQCFIYLYPAHSYNKQITVTLAEKSV